MHQGRIPISHTLRRFRFLFNRYFTILGHEAPEVIPWLSFLGAGTLWATYFYGRRILWDSDTSQPEYWVTEDTSVMREITNRNENKTVERKNFRDHPSGTSLLMPESRVIHGDTIHLVYPKEHQESAFENADNPDMTLEDSQSHPGEALFTKIQ